MKTFDRILAAVLALAALLIVGINIFGRYFGGSEQARAYRVEIYRIVAQIEREGPGAVSLAGCEYVENVEIVGQMHGAADEGGEMILYPNALATDSDYLIRRIGGILYRFDYRADMGTGGQISLATVNAVMAAMALLLFTVLLFVRRQILRPFEKLSELPYQLSRGMLATPLKESKSHFFGRFVWGMDLLRENTQEQRQRTLSLQRDRETMLLSLSHDIKTPLLAIKLYAKALVKGIYSEKEKQLETAENIGKKADEIEAYLTQITDALREDFLSLSVQEGEFYLSGLVREIKGHYCGQLALSGTDFAVGEYDDCLIKGDIDRSVEVLQNLMENAIKYGNGRWISLAFSQEENCVLVTVKNSGCTLPAAELPHIFESFWRGSNVGSTPGSGLGLYICRKLMHRMNGEVFAACRGDELAVTVVFCKAS